MFQNLDILKANDPDYVLILAGDHVYKMDYGRMLAYHVSRQADMTVACIEVPLEDATAFGVMGVDERLARAQLPRKAGQAAVRSRASPTRRWPAWASTCSTPSSCTSSWRATRTIRNSSHDFGKDIIPHLVPRYRVFAHRFQDSCVGMNDNRPYWRDVGTVDAYWEANIDLVHVTPELNLYDDDWPIWTYQEQLPPAKFVFDDDGRRGMAVDSMVSGGCIISGSTVRGSLLFSNVRVHSFCSIEDSVILPDVQSTVTRETAALCRRPALRAAGGLHGRLRPGAGPQAFPRHRARHHADHPRHARPESLHYALMSPPFNMQPVLRLARPGEDPG